MKTPFGPIILRWLRKNTLLLICLGLILLLAKHALNLGLKTGFDGERVQLKQYEHYAPAKTLWDWLQLFGAPAVLAVIAYVFQQATKNADQRLATESQRHSILQAYIDGISAMLISEKWERDAWAFRRYGSKYGRSALQQVARARTFALLDALNVDPADQKRRGQIIRFLMETGLIRAGADERPSLVDLSGADLSGVFLERANVSGVDLRGVNLREASLVQANLSDAYLTGADLRGADLRWTNLSGIKVNFERPNQAATINTKMDPKWQRIVELLASRLGGQSKSLKHSDLSSAFLRGVSFRDADLRYANLRRSLLTNADLYKADLRGADLTGATLDSVYLRGARINVLTRLDKKWKRVWRIVNESDRRMLSSLIAHADLSNACLNVVFWDKVVFESADLSSAMFRNSYLVGAQFHEDTKLRFTDFTEAALSGATFRGRSLFCNWGQAELGGADFSGMTIMGGSFKGAKLQGAKFIGTTMQLVDLRNSFMEGADLTGARFMNCKLEGSVLSNAILINAEIPDAELKKCATLQGAVFS